jgi:biotin operon repressor
MADPAPSPPLPPVPPEVRANAFASVELILDLFYAVTTHFKLDLESIWILAVIAQETMRPWILNPALAERHMADYKVPDAIRGAVSRRMVASKTGLPRETVRRRIAELEAAGIVVTDDRGNVRMPGDRIADPAYHKVFGEARAAVARYQQRLAEFETGRKE